LTLAFEQDIPLKTIAFVLQKSLTAVSKKITHLGLRRVTMRCARLKGRSYGMAGNPQALQDVCRMLALVKAYAPRSPHPTPSRAKKSTPLGLLSQKNCTFSLAYALPYSLLEEQDVALPGIERGGDRSLYVPFYYVEKWALLKGFSRVQAGLRERGLCYWKQGQYFSQAQLLFQLNGIRLAKPLEPLHLHEEETQN